MVNVLLVERHLTPTDGVNGRDTAQVYKRIRVGHVCLARWMDTDTEMNTIILEWISQCFYQFIQSRLFKIYPDLLGLIV